MTVMLGDPALRAEKQALRQLVRERRQRFVSGLGAGERAIAFRVLPGAILARLPAGATIALYHAIAPEAPTDNIAAQLAGRGHPIALPSIDRLDGILRFVRWSPDQILVPGPFRTLQPHADAPELTPDVIIAPLVAFDAALNRIGQGGGYYDRAFAAFPDALRIGLAWSAQRVDLLPTEATDVPLDMVITECAVHERAGAAA